jgi:hypothetical protein
VHSNDGSPRFRAPPVPVVGRCSAETVGVHPGIACKQAPAGGPFAILKTRLARSLGYYFGCRQGPGKLGAYPIKIHRMLTAAR